MRRGMGTYQLSRSLVILVSLSFPHFAGANFECKPKSLAAKTTCGEGVLQKEGIAEARKIQRSHLSSEKLIKEQAVKIAELERGLFAQRKACKAALSETEGICQAQYDNGITTTTNGETLMAQGVQEVNLAQQMALVGGIAASPTKINMGKAKIEQGNTQRLEGTRMTTEAEAGLALIKEEETGSLIDIKSALKTVGEGALKLVQIAAALGFDLFGDDPDATLPDVQAADADICSSVSGADLLICGGGTPDRQTASGGVGNTGSITGTPIAAGIPTSEGADREAFSSSTDSGSGLASTGGGGSGGGLGFGGGGAAGGGAEEAGAAEASLKSDSGSGYFGGSGGGGGGGASSAGKLSFDRFGLRERLKKATTKAEKKKIVAAFNKANQLKGKGRGLASTGTDGKAGPFQDNFQVIRKAHKQNYRSLFHK